MNPTAVRPVAVLAAACALLSSAACMVTVDSSEYTAREEKRFQVSGVPEVSLVTFDGSLEIRSWDRQEVLVEIEKRGPNQEQAEAIEVRAEQSGNVVRVEVKKPAGKTAGFLRQSSSARIIASMPRRSKVTARTGDGSIKVERIEGELDLNTGDGSVRGYDVAGTIRVHTGDGSIRMDHVDGAISVETGDGSARINGRLAAVSLVTGDGTVVVRADEGSVMAEEWAIRTGDGGVRLDLPAGFAADLDASTADGRIRLEGMEGRGDPEEPAGDGERGRRSLKRTLAGGGKVLRVRTGSGTITIGTS